MSWTYSSALGKCIDSELKELYAGLIVQQWVSYVFVILDSSSMRNMWPQSRNWCMSVHMWFCLPWWNGWEWPQPMQSIDTLPLSIRMMWCKQPDCSCLEWTAPFERLGMWLWCLLSIDPLNLFVDSIGTSKDLLMSYLRQFFSNIKTRPVSIIWVDCVLFAPWFIS
jgi:hypothetical protein